MTANSPKRLQLPRRWYYLIEIVGVILFAFFSARLWLEMEPGTRLIGMEVEWFTSAMTRSTEIFQETGRLPWWQPYLSGGQPIIDDSMAFILNPFSSVPSLIWGIYPGLPISIVLHFIIAGLGGWFLGWSLGWGILGRLALALLLVLKGNMQSSLGLGFFQLGIAQAYFPWILAGALAIPRHIEKRWPVTLFALSFTLMFFVGNLYYTLPMALITCLVVLFYSVSIIIKPFSITLNNRVLRRFLSSTLFTAGLMSAAAITILMNFGLMGKHPDHLNWDPMDVIGGIWQFVNPLVVDQGGMGARYGNSYTFISPLWFVVLLFVLIPPIKLLHRLVKPEDWRLWAFAIIGLLWFASWGMGINPLIIWMYENLPLIGQWRFPERMLTVAAFLMVFLIAFRVDGLHRALAWSPDSSGAVKLKAGRRVIVALLAVVCAVAVFDINQTRELFGHHEYLDVYTARCVGWLRERYPNDFLSIWRRDYVTITTFLENHVRMANISVDYDLNGVESEIYPYDLTARWPEYRMASWFDDPAELQAEGFYPLEDSPKVDAQSLLPCIWRNPDALSYVFSAPLSELQSQGEVFDSSITTSIETFERSGEHIAIVVMPLSDEESVVVAQDIAYPGWIAKVNGEESKLESVGGLLGVILPSGDGPVLIEFIYTAPTLRLGGIITLLTAIVCAAYLLQLDQVPARLRTWQKTRAARRETDTISTALVPAQTSTPSLAEKSSASQLATASAETVAKPAVIRTITPVSNPEQTPPPTLEVHVSSGRHRVVLPPSEEPLVVEVVVEKQRWLGINTLISIFFAGLIGANAMQWFSSKRRNQRD